MNIFVFSPNTVAKSSYVNQNFSDLLAATSIVGEVRMYSGTVAPSGWLIADGSAVNRTTYSDLFSVIGTAFGVGNGTTTFNIPDMRDKFPIGVSGSKARASTGGSATKDVSHLHSQPTHGHGPVAGNCTATVSACGVPGFIDANGSYTVWSGGDNTGSSGSGVQDVLNPYVALNYLIKY